MMLIKDSISLLSGHKLLFWDFDGVIKESTDIKSKAYFQLFESFGKNVAERIQRHHDENGGMSRFDKLPKYLHWVGVEPDEATVATYCDQFSKQVLQDVINAPYVPGVEGYLRNNPNQQVFILVSATPHKELIYILKVLDLYKCFNHVYGAPMSKKDAIYDVLHSQGIPANNCLMIGDAQSDLDAASANGVPFLLRRHNSNEIIFKNYSGFSTQDFTSL